MKIDVSQDNVEEFIEWLKEYRDRISITIQEVDDSTRVIYHVRGLSPSPFYYFKFDHD